MGIVATQRQRVFVKRGREARESLESEVGVEEEISSDELNRVVSQINRISRTASLEFALRVGAVIIHHFYGGSTEAWRLRGPKTASFRRLSAHPNLPMSAGALYRCVAMFELCDRLGAPSRWRNLGASHLRVVLGLDGANQERLLSVANSEQWTVRTLQEELNRCKLVRHTSGGRRVQPAVIKIVRWLRRCLDQHAIGMDTWENIPPDELEAALQTLDEVSERVEKIRDWMAHRRSEEFNPPLPSPGSS